MIHRKNKIDPQSLQTTCKQCGICCTKGGPAFHGADLSLLLEQKIPWHDLITLRAGEFAWDPVTESVQAIQQEIIKIRGSGSKWTCCYFNASNNACSIYQKRPIACKTLQCWNPSKSLALVGKDLLSRVQILQNEPTLQELVEQYDTGFPMPDFTALKTVSASNEEITIADLEKQVNNDLTFREREIGRSKLVSDIEFFLFGRPLFQLLQPFGVQVFQDGNSLRLQYKEQG
jgi:Fe-S-cluster containining protein